MGGKAFDNVVPVERDEVLGIVQDFADMLGITNYEILGSGGKKAVSGDIDIGVSDKECHIKHLLEALTATLGGDNINTRALVMGQLFCRYTPPDSNPVQIDLQVGDLDLLKFTYWSPDEGTSGYSGLHRTELLKACAKVLNSQTVSYGDRVVARTGYTLMPNEGLIRSTRWCKPLVKGVGYVTKMTEVTRAERKSFEAHFPTLPMVAHAVIRDVDWICWEMFGDISAQDLATYEEISDAIVHSSKYRDADLIWDLYTERLKTIRAIIPRRII